MRFAGDPKYILERADCTHTQVGEIYTPDCQTNSLRSPYSYYLWNINDKGYFSGKNLKFTQGWKYSVSGVLSTLKGICVHGNMVKLKRIEEIWEANKSLGCFCAIWNPYHCAGWCYLCRRYCDKFMWPYKRPFLLIQ